MRQETECLGSCVTMSAFRPGLHFWSRGWVSVVRIEARLRAGRNGVRIPVGEEDFFPIQTRPLSLHSIGYRASFQEVKRPVREDHSSVEVETEWSYTSNYPLRFHDKHKTILPLHFRSKP